MRYFLDTEFLEGGRTKPIQLVSIGLVREDGEPYYCISSEFNPADANDWADTIGHLNPGGHNLLANWMENLIQTQLSALGIKSKQITPKTSTF